MSISFKMKKLNKIQLAIYGIGGLLMLVGAVLYPIVTELAMYIFAAGSLMFAAMQFCATYDGDDITIRRLRRQQILGAVLFMLAGAAMFANDYLAQMFQVRNGWILLMAIGTVLQTYTVFRLSSELKKKEEEK